MDWLQFNSDFHSDFSRSKAGHTRLMKKLVKALQHTSDDQDTYTQTAAVAIYYLHLLGLSDVAKQCATGLIQAESSNQSRSTFRTYGLANYYAAVNCDFSTAGAILRAYDPPLLTPSNHDELAIRCAVYWRRAVAEQVAGDTVAAENSLCKARALAEETMDGTMIQITHRGASAVRYIQGKPSQVLDEAIKGLFLAEKGAPSDKFIHAELLMLICLAQMSDVHLLGWRVLDLWRALLRCSIEMPGYADSLYFRTMAPSPGLLLAKITQRDISRTASRRWPTAVREQMTEIREHGCTSCGVKEPLDLDHLIPYSWGGTSTLLNARWLCQRCNRRRSDYFGWDPYAYFWLARGIDLMIESSTVRRTSEDGLLFPTAG